MISNKILELLNKQIKIEGESAQIYLSMHTWAADQGFEGAAKFLMASYHEEVSHMIKIINYVSDKNERAIITELEAPEKDFGSLKECFDTLLDHELFVAENIHALVKACRESECMPTEMFMHWYVIEQIEEEKIAYAIIDKIKLAGDNKAAILEADKYIGCIK